MTVFKKKKTATRGYKTSKRNDKELSQVCVYLTADLVDFVDEFTFKMKKKLGVRVSNSELVRAALKRFSELSSEEQEMYLEK